MFGSFTTIVAMTLLLPFLPLYVEQLGVKDHAAIFVAFLATAFLIREKPVRKRTDSASKQGAWASVDDKRPAIAMLATGLLLMVANMSIEPIITVYVAQLAKPQSVTMVAGYQKPGDS
ncbi:hypothetical protein OKW45_000429 [Paraburkholderia sp. WSM4175]